MPETRFTHVGLCVRDIAKSRAFYERIFGYVADPQIVVEGEPVAKLMRLTNPLKFLCAHLRKGSFELDVLQPVTPAILPAQERPLSEPGLQCITFMVPTSKGSDVRASITALGGKVLPGGAFARDPDGQLIHLQPAPAGEAVAFSHITVGVTDLAKSRAFFQNVLGFRFISPGSPDSAALTTAFQLRGAAKVRSAILAKGPARLELLSFTEPAPTPHRVRPFNEPALIHLAMRDIPRDGVANLYERVGAYGGRVLTETIATNIKEDRWKSMEGTSYVTDPDGQLICLFLEGFLDATVNPFAQATKVG